MAHRQSRAPSNSRVDLEAAQTKFDVHAKRRRLLLDTGSLEPHSLAAGELDAAADAVADAVPKRRLPVTRLASLAGARHPNPRPPLPLSAGPAPGWVAQSREGSAGRRCRRRRHRRRRAPPLRGRGPGLARRDAARRGEGRGSATAGGRLFPIHRRLRWAAGAWGRGAWGRRPVAEGGWPLRWRRRNGQTRRGAAAARSVWRHRPVVWRGRRQHGSGGDGVDAGAHPFPPPACRTL